MNITETEMLPKYNGPTMYIKHVKLRRRAVWPADREFDMLDVYIVQQIFAEWQTRHDYPP